MAFDKAARAQGLADELNRADPADVVVVDPTAGRPAVTPARKPPTPRVLTAGSVAWDDRVVTKLRVLVAGERGLTHRAIHNVLLRRFLDLPAGDRRAIIDEAVDWEREQRG